MNETILIVGSGAREHAIAVALSRSPQQPRLLCFGSARNPGIARLCAVYASGSLADPHAIARFASDHGATLAVVGPEAPLAAGAADALLSAGVPAAGPTADLARIESSKGFARDLLASHGIAGNPEFLRAPSLQEADAWLHRFQDRYVIKDDGLAGGKGVKVYGDHLHSLDEALAYCRELAEAGHRFVLEEKLEGEEFSLMSFCDGRTLRHMPAVQDHKRAYEGDRGPNTGGMGTYTDADHRLPFLTAGDVAQAQQINEQVAAALAEECGAPYRGILYGGFMATGDGVRLIEYNARFGDPESLNLLTLLESDFVAICRATATGSLQHATVGFAHQASVCKYLVPEGYPDAPRKGAPIIVPEALPERVAIYLGAVDERDGKLIATGSRTVAVVGCGATLDAAEALCQRVIENISGPFFFRRDIGTHAAIARRVAHMEALRPR